MPTILRVQKGVNIEERGPEELATRVAVIQALIPLGLQAVADALQHDVLALAGPQYARGHRPPGCIGGRPSAARSTWPIKSFRSRGPGSGIGTRIKRCRCPRINSSNSPGPPMRACSGGSCRG